MNLYLIVEGGETELQAYPKWLSYTLPQLSQVEDYRAVSQNNYYIFSGGGIPSMYNHIVNAIKDINAIKKYTYFIICVDSEQASVEQRKEKILDFIKAEGVALVDSCELKFVIQHRCIETWFLGNRKVYKRNPQGEKFKAYSSFYNVETNDPELMKKYAGFKLTTHFHQSYLREMLKEYNIRYTKSNPKAVLKETYFDEIVKRTLDEPTHLGSFSDFMALIEEIKEKL